MAEWIIEANDTEEAAEGKFAFIREVVRCKDCDKNSFTKCPMAFPGKSDFDFCSRCKRRDDDD